MALQQCGLKFCAGTVGTAAARRQRGEKNQFRQPETPQGPLQALAVGKWPLVPRASTEHRPQQTVSPLVQELQVAFHLHMTQTWEHEHESSSDFPDEIRSTQISLTVPVDPSQEPKGCTYFACTSPDSYQKKTSIILDHTCAIHNSHTRAEFIRSCVFRRSNVHLKATIHSLLFN